MSEPVFRCGLGSLASFSFAAKVRLPRCFLRPKVVCFKWYKYRLGGLVSVFQMCAALQREALGHHVARHIRISGHGVLVDLFASGFFG